MGGRQGVFLGPARCRLLDPVLAFVFAVVFLVAVFFAGVFVFSWAACDGDGGVLVDFGAVGGFEEGW